MGNGTIGVLVLGSLLVGAPAWSEREARLEPVGLTVRFPDGWTAEPLYLKEGVSLYRPGEELVGSVEVLRGTDCDEMMTWSKDHHPLAISATALRGEHWIGRSYTLDGVNRGDFCRPVRFDGQGAVVWVEALDADVAQLIAIADGAIERGVTRAAPSGAAADARMAAIHDVVLPTVKLTVTVPGGWEATTRDGFDTVIDGAGEAIGQVFWQQDDCDALLARGADSVEGPKERTDLAGWRGVEGVAEGSTQALFCRDVRLSDGRDVNLMVASFDPLTTRRLVDAVTGGLERYLAASGSVRPAARRSPLARFLPDRYELGLGRLTDGPTDQLEIDRGWGPTVMIERALYDRGAPALGYKARGTVTGAGFAGYAEGALGASVKGLSIQAVAGVGAAGEHAPLGVHAGVHGGLLLPQGLEAEGGYAWTSGGTVARFEGRFVVRLAARRAVSFGIGYERREGSQLLTIDLGTLRTPDL